jgi:hypothetical protein
MARVAGARLSGSPRRIFDVERRETRAGQRIRKAVTPLLADYLPGPDADYQAWVTNFVTYAKANLAALGLVAADITPITTGQTAFNSGFSAHIASKAPDCLQ